MAWSNPTSKKLWRFAVVTGLLIVGVVAAQAQESGTVTPFKNITIKPVGKVDTRVWRNPITEAIRDYELEHENPVTSLWKEVPTEANTLPVGEMGNYSRGTVRSRFPGILYTGLRPADPDMAVGPNHVVLVVNSDLAFYDKLGVKQFQQRMDGASGFFGSVQAGDFVFDPKAFYDPIAQRYFIVALDVQGISSGTTKTSNILVAVSDDNNPNGTWFLYKINSKFIRSSDMKEFWMDYPGFGFNKHSIAICGNLFEFQGNTASPGTQFIVIGKAGLLTGGSSNVSYLYENNSFSVQLSQTTDPNENTLYGMCDLNSSTLRVFGFTGLPATPTMQFTSITVPSYVYPNSTDGAASVNGNLLDGLDGRLINVVHRKIAGVGHLLTTHGVLVSSSDRRLMVRWYDVNLNGFPGGGAPTPEQSGNIQGSAGQSFFMPSINMNSLGDISVVYSRSSSSIIADMVVSSRKASDPSSTMGAPVLLGTSTGTSYGAAGQPPNRWGDYSDVNIDPSNDTTFWCYAMLGDAGSGSPSTRWKTEFYTYTVSTPSTDLTYVPSSATVVTGTNQTGTVANMATSDNQYYGLSSILQAALGQVMAVDIGFTATKPAALVSKMVISVEGNGTFGSTGQIFIFNWVTMSWDNLKQYPMAAIDTTSSYTINSGFVNYYSPTNQIRLMVRGIRPYVRSRGWRLPPSSFTLRLDQVKIVVTHTS